MVGPVGNQGIHSMGEQASPPVSQAEFLDSLKDLSDDLESHSSTANASAAKDMQTLSNFFLQSPGHGEDYADPALTIIRETIEQIGNQFSNPPLSGVVLFSQRGSGAASFIQQFKDCSISMSAFKIATHDFLNNMNMAQSGAFSQITQGRSFPMQPYASGIMQIYNQVFNAPIGLLTDEDVSHMINDPLALYVLDYVMCRETSPLFNGELAAAFNAIEYSLPSSPSPAEINNFITAWSQTCGIANNHK